MFGVAFVMFGLQQLLFGDFVPGRPPAWPLDFPGKLICIYGTGVCFIAAGVAIAAERRVRVAALVIAALVLTGALLRNVSPALADHTFGGAWTRLGKAVALCGGALAIAGVGTKGSSQRIDAFALAGRIAFAIYLIDSGIQHFLFTSVVQTLVPTWIPHPHVWTLMAGTALIAGGIGLIVSRTAPLAGFAVGVMIFSWFVILHIPRAIAAAPAAQRNEWIAVFEALAFAGIALVVTDTRRERRG
jgi:uncharacterized membrane protein